jgi:hypothetical protein
MDLFILDAVSFQLDTIGRFMPNDLLALVSKLLATAFQKREDKPGLPLILG